MNKTILIIYPYRNHRNLMSIFSQKLVERGYKVDVICIDDLHVINHSKLEWGYWIKYFIDKGKSTSLLGRIFRKVFLSFMLCKIFQEYDLIDFHSFVEFDLKLAAYCQKHNIPYDITLWGSDLMRANDDRIERMKVGFDGCRYIKGTDNLHDLLKEKFLSRYNSKRRIVYFGNSDYDVLDNLTEEEAEQIKNTLYGNVNGKLIVVCGYNGIKYQNHETMIQSFYSLRSKYCSRVHLVVPMTYGAQPKYINEIRMLLDQTGYSYTIFDRFLSNQEVAVIRKTADFVVNIQKTDAFAGSLQDHLYCEEVLLIGEWLQYTALDKANVFYLKTTLNDLTDSIDYTISNLAEYQKKCYGNHEKMKALTSWDSVIDNWISVYGE